MTAAEADRTLRPSVPVKLGYGLGAVCDAGFTAIAGFLFFYYTAVLGLSGSLVGAALFIGLCADAAVDPFIGSWSDNLKSKLGRRVPLMLVAIPLFALAVTLLFAPPRGLSQPLLFAWLAVTTVAARSFLSLFHVPYIALGAEMAEGYAERSSVVAYRAVMGIVVGVAVTALAFSVYFAREGGLQNAASYPGFGWSAAIGMAAGMVACCLGIRAYAARLPQAAPVATPLIRRIPGEVVEVFRNRSFRILFFSAVVFYAAIGLNATLASHASVFVWKLETQMMQVPAYAYLAGVLAGVAVAPRLTRRFEKKVVVLAGLTLVVVFWSLLPLLRATGVVTATGGEAMVLLAGKLLLVGIGAGFCAIAYPSMMADAADEHEHLFGRRREGLYFSGLGFAAKGASGLGVLLGGFALDLVRFPKDAGQQTTEAIPEAVQAGLMIAWGPAAGVIGIVAMVMFASYGIDRRRHDEISAALHRKRALGGATAASAQ